MMVHTPTVFDTIVLGAGFSGLTAARILSASGARVLIIEARNRTGGRAYTCTGFPHPVDLGCSWVHGWDEGVPVRTVLEQLHIPAHVPTSTPSLLFRHNGSISEGLAGRLRTNFAFVNSLSSQSDKTAISPTTPLSSMIFDKNSPLYEGLESEQRPLAGGLARTLEIGLGARLEEVALRWQGFGHRFVGTDAAPEGGFQRATSLLLSVAESSGAILKLNEAVTSVSSPSPSGPLVVSTNSPSGTVERYEAHTVICTLPLGVLQHVPPTFFDPPLPQPRADVIAHTHVGTLAKVVLGYADTWWPSDVGNFTILPAFSPSAKIDRSDPAALLSSIPLVVTSFASGALPDPHPTLLIYISAAVAPDIERLQPSAVAAAAHFLLIKCILGESASERIAEPRHSVVTSWSVDPYAYGATSTPPLVGDVRSPADFAELAKPLWNGRLGFAGEHTDVDNRGSVTGAVVSVTRRYQCKCVPQ
ncbi:Polyamine oxidase 3 [Grifola frondosa]|uniref:Polyamine oxidase 3 n=1 Tax=Grifola frondosa TaxID=5627 RepID=A0A1C7LKF1_GRIFR|nr:Polyamine oxidase 3 [Grifola frondosa]